MTYLAFDKLVFTRKALPKRPAQAAQRASELALGMGIRNFAVQVAKQSYSTYLCENQLTNQVMFTNLHFVHVSLQLTTSITQSDSLRRPSVTLTIEWKVGMFLK